MLVLSRQRDEAIMIGGNVKVVVVDIRGDKVRLGIIAPEEIEVHRKEIFDAIQNEQQENAKSIPAILLRKGPQRRPRRGSLVEKVE